MGNQVSFASSNCVFRYESVNGSESHELMMYFIHCVLQQKWSKLISEFYVLVVRTLTQKQNLYKSYKIFCWGGDHWKVELRRALGLDSPFGSHGNNLPTKRKSLLVQCCAFDAFREKRGGTLRNRLHSFRLLHTLLELCYIPNHPSPGSCVGSLSNVTMM